MKYSKTATKRKTRVLYLQEQLARSVMKLLHTSLTTRHSLTQFIFGRGTQFTLVKSQSQVRNLLTKDLLMPRLSSAQLLWMKTSLSSETSKLCWDRAQTATISAPRTSECFTALKPEGLPISLEQDLYPSQTKYLKKPHFLATVSLFCCSLTLCNSQLSTNGHHTSNIHDSVQDPSWIHQSEHRPEMLLGLRPSHESPLLMCLDGNSMEATFHVTKSIHREFRWRIFYPIMCLVSWIREMRSIMKSEKMSCWLPTIAEGALYTTISYWCIYKQQWTLLFT